jgi:alpha-amylase
MARYHGGDWAGLEQKLDYIEELGVTTLWISPVVKNIETDANVDGYHGYWAVDLTRRTPTSATSTTCARLSTPRTTATCWW